MPATLTYPGVYIEEIPSGVRTITGVATSITAFLGRALRGPVNQAVTLNNYGDFESAFGGLDPAYPLGYSVRDFFQNGGSQAIVVRLYKSDGGNAKSALKLPGGLNLAAVAEGTGWTTTS
jgi:phage tail sheath protein FI